MSGQLLLENVLNINIFVVPAPAPPDMFVSHSSLSRYDAIESVESRMQEVLSPTPDGEYVGSAIVQEVFNIGGTGNIAGSKCRDGIIKKGSNVRVMRGDKILIESKVRTLRNFKVCTECIDRRSR